MKIGSIGSDCETESAWPCSCCLLVYATGLTVAISLRQPVLLRIMPDRITLYSVDADGQIHNRFRMQASNRGRVAGHRIVVVADLDNGASIEGIGGREELGPGETVQVAIRRRGAIHCMHQESTE